MDDDCISIGLHLYSIYRAGPVQGPVEEISINLIILIRKKIHCLNKKNYATIKE
jgi:hypothetical protein